MGKKLIEQVVDGLLGEANDSYKIGSEDRHGWTPPTRMFRVTVNDIILTVNQNGRVTGGLIGNMDTKAEQMPGLVKGEKRIKPVWGSDFNWYVKNWVCPERGSVPWTGHN